MRNNIFYHELVENDIKNAKEWFKNISCDLENKFEKSLKKAILNIDSNPKAFQIKYKNIRSLLIKEFNFSLFYCIKNDNEIIILAVIHSSRNPNLWKDRI